MIQCLSQQADAFFFFPSAILTRSSSGEGGRSESDGEAKPFCCCFIHILGAPPSWQRGELPAVSQYPSLIAAAPPVNPVSVSPFAAFALMPFELIKLALAHLFSWLLLPLNWQDLADLIWNSSLDGYCWLCELVGNPRQKQKHTRSLKYTVYDAKL